MVQGSHTREFIVLWKKRASSKREEDWRNAEGPESWWKAEAITAY